MHSHLSRLDRFSRVITFPQTVLYDPEKQFQAFLANGLFVASLPKIAVAAYFGANYPQAWENPLYLIFAGAAAVASSSSAMSLGVISRRVYGKHFQGFFDMKPLSSTSN